VNEEVTRSLETINAVNTEFFYWVSIALMMLIHAGFLFYEGGASRWIRSRCCAPRPTSDPARTKGAAS
jgi:hypothetical protein